jgi:hypothetical protein
VLHAMLRDAVCCRRWGVYVILPLSLKTFSGPPVYHQAVGLLIGS